VQAGGRIEYVRLFSIVAIFILLIACINFMNLSTARASRRLKEVGIKKTLGSSRFALILQFLTEAVLMAFLSVLLAGVIVALFLPVFNQITGKQLGASWNAQLVGWSLLITFLTGILSGSYPAFYLSAFNPAGVLKGKIKNSAAELFARKGLVIFQFMISLVLIIAVMVIYRQVEYVQSKNLGYDKANVVYFDKEGALERNKDAFLAELKKIPGIVNASAMMQGIVQSKGVGASTYGIDWPGKTEKDLINFTIRAVDYDLVETLGIQVRKGRSFSRRFGSDSSNVLFNESAIRVMGLKNPVGTQVKIWNKDMTIIGVVKDFHLSSLHEPIAPMVFMYNPKNTTSILAKIKAGQEKETLHAVTSLYRKFNPGYVFEYHFLDEAYQAQYVAEQRVSVLSRLFAGLAILISCLGLFGLASFNAEIRTKEIGVRKVLGASVSNIILLLSRDFIRLILLSVIIAFPIAWWAMNQWLDGFAYHIRIPADIFILAGMAIVAITLLTIGYQSLLTALRNPVTSLRTE
jgi:ABC-type antimicrobial peptide transport system permease subunit